MIEIRLSDMLGGEPLMDPKTGKVRLESDAAFRARIVAIAAMLPGGVPLDAHIAIGAELDAIGGQYRMRRSTYDTTAPRPDC